MRSSSQQSVHVRSPQAAELAATRLRGGAGATVRAGTGPDVIEITRMDSAEVGKLAAAHGITLFELIPVKASLRGGVHGTDPGQRGVPGGGGGPVTGATTAFAAPDHRAAFRPATFGDVLRSEWKDQAPFGPVDVLGADPP